MSKPVPHRGYAERRRLLEAMLAASGELGYRRAGVEQVSERAGATPARFYSQFRDTEDCFAQAHSGLSEVVYARLAGAARRRPGPRQALAAALGEALEMCAAQPTLARALLVEPLVAGGEAREQHHRFLNQLSEVLNRARGEISGANTVPPSSAAFMVGAITTMLRDKLMAGEAERAPELLPGLLHLAVLLHLGEEPAGEDMALTPVG